MARLSPIPRLSLATELNAPRRESATWTHVRDRIGQVRVQGAEGLVRNGESASASVNWTPFGKASDGVDAVGTGVVGIVLGAVVVAGNFVAAVGTVLGAEGLGAGFGPAAFSSG